MTSPSRAHTWLIAPALAALMTGACASSSSPDTAADPMTPRTMAHDDTADRVDAAAPAGDAQACAGITVFFEIGSSDLDLAGEQRVDELARCLADRNVREVVVTGRADPSGTTIANDKLSMARAETVVAALKRRGLSTDMLLIQAYGESDASQLKVMWPYERRAEVDVTASIPQDQ